MNARPLGRSGLRIAPLVFGANVFGWTVDQPTAFRLLDRFIDGGFNAVDTADVYSRWVPGNKGGESEAMIGNWLKANPTLKGEAAVKAVANQSWDVSVKSLVAFPQVLEPMNDQLDWTKKLVLQFESLNCDRALIILKLFERGALFG